MDPRPTPLTVDALAALATYPATGEAYGWAIAQAAYEAAEERERSD